MQIFKIASFSDGNIGGNPAGVALCETLPAVAEMQAIAADINFSETAFAAWNKAAQNWRVRYFSPQTEVPFCGHATIALGAALAGEHGEGVYNLALNDAEITVEGRRKGEYLEAALQSPPTRHSLLDDAELNATLELFGFVSEQLDVSIAPARIHAGADHYIVALKNRADLARMDYDLEQGKSFMRERGLITIMLVCTESDMLFNVRNAFASGGVFEDPATGAAAAAFAGYLRDSGKRGAGRIEIIQGEDMGARSLINAEFSATSGESVRVSGCTRLM